MKAVLQSALAAAVGYYKRNPTRVIGYAATVVVFAANLTGIVVRRESVEAALAVVIPLVIAVESTHRKVTPSK